MSDICVQTNQILSDVKGTMNNVLLKKAFQNYNVFLPRDVFSLIDEFLSDSNHIKCRYCEKILLQLCVVKPFIKRVATTYQVFNDNVFTKDGMLTCAQDSVAETTSYTKGEITLETPPEILNICNVCVKNEVVTYKQMNWYKCMFSYDDNEFIYVCAHCFLSKKRKLRIYFYSLKRLIIHTN